MTLPFSVERLLGGLALDADAVWPVQVVLLLCAAAAIAERAKGVAARAPIDQFLRRFDVRERFTTVVRAPADLVLDVASGFDLQSITPVRLIFRLREKLLRSTVPATPREPTGLVAEMIALGWGILDHAPGRHLVAGAACEPWKADVVFTPIPLDRFTPYAEPGRVKIAWTLEAEPLGPELTRFASETRAAATDRMARARFRRYWFFAGPFIVLIRLFLLPAVRREAERRWRSTRGTP